MCWKQRSYVLGTALICAPTPLTCAPNTAYMCADVCACMCASTNRLDLPDARRQFAVAPGTRAALAIADVAILVQDPPMEHRANVSAPLLHRLASLDHDAFDPALCLRPRIRYPSGPSGDLAGVELAWRTRLQNQTQENTNSVLVPGTRTPTCDSTKHCPASVQAWTLGRYWRPAGPLPMTATGSLPPFEPALEAGEGPERSEVDV
eukprot:3463842-Rhodomonas_salina.2